MERELLISNTDHTSFDIVKNLSALLPSNDEEQESATEAFTKITTADRMALGTDFSKESNNDNDMISLLMSTSGKDEEHVRSIIKRAVDQVNSVNDSGVTPLMLASKYGNVNVVKFLLWAGAFVNKKDHFKQSALLYTIQFFNGQIRCDGKCELFDIPIKGGRGCLTSRIKILKDLLMHGADPNISNAAYSHGSTALIILAGAPLFPQCRCSGRNECYGIKLLQESCHLLLRHGANVNIRDPSGMTALMHAVKRRFTAVCETLIEFGADINLQDNQGRSALMHGVPHLEICTFLLQQGADVHLTSQNGLTALNMVSYLDSPELCKVLIAFGADICDRGHDGKSFLMNLVQTGSSKDLSYLLDVDVNANINFKFPCGKTLLMEVIEADCQEWFEDLVSRGVDVDAQDYEGKTALTYAIQKDSRMWCRLLTSLTSDINMSDKQGKTNLTCAVENDSQSWAFHLIDQGIDVNRQDFLGKTALMYAIQTFQQEDNASYWADLLLGVRSNVNIQDGTGKTALMYAIAFGRQHWIYFLIEYGNVEFGITDCDGRTACMYSVLFYPDVNLLRVKPRVLNTGDKDGRTVLMYAALYNTSLFDELIDMKSVDMNSCDREGRQAFDYFYRVKQNGKLRVNHVTLSTFFKDLHLILTTNRHASGILQLLHKNIILVSSHDGRCLLEQKTRSVFHDVTYWQENHSNTLDRSKLTSSLQSFILQGNKGMVQLCVYNGVVLKNCNLSSIILALSLGYSDIFKYFLATWYLTVDDMKDMLAAVQVIKYKKISGGGFGGSRLLHGTSVLANLNSSTIAEILDEEEVDLLMEATSQPWPLVTLAFITVSSTIGGGPDRQEKISHLPLPVPLKKMLNFEREVTSCPVEDWDDIPLCFNTVEYENLDKRRPLLYHWPIGSAWKPNQTSTDN